MATDFSITPAAGGAAVFTVVVAGFDAIPGNYWDIAESDEPVYEYQSVKSGGVDGSSEPNAGFRSRRIYGEVLIVQASQANCKAIKAAVDAMAGGACAVVLPNDSQSYPASYLRHCKTIEQPTDSGMSTWIMRVAIELEQMRLA